MVEFPYKVSMVTYSINVVGGENNSHHMLYVVHCLSKGTKLKTKEKVDSVSLVA